MNTTPSTTSVSDLANLVTLIRLFETEPCYKSIYKLDSKWEDVKAGTDEGYTSDDIHAIVNQIEGVACELLINSDGSCNFTNIRKLRDTHNIHVRAGETDSFGWLTVVIPTAKGIIVYG